MILIDIFKRWRKKRQWKAYFKGFNSGYYYACKKFLVMNGRFAVLKSHDIVMGAQFHRTYNSEKMHRIWKAGFEFGMTDAYAFYNSGEDPKNGKESFAEQEARVYEQFEKEYEYTNGWNSQIKQLP